MAFIAIFRDTMRQVVAQTIIFWMIGFVLLLLLIALLVDLPDYDKYREWIETAKQHEMEMRENTEKYEREMGIPFEKREIVVETKEYWAREQLSDIVVNFDWVVFLPFSMIFIVSASFLVTRKLAKGTVEQYLSKPVSRFTIFMGRSVAIFMVFMIPAAIALIGVHCILALRFGVAPTTFLCPLAYAAVLGFSITGLCTALGNLTRGPILCIVVFTLLLVLSFVIISALHQTTDGFVANNSGEHISDPKIHTPFLQLLYDLLILVRRYVFIPALDMMFLSNYSHDPDGVVYTWRPLWVGLAQGVLGFGIGALAFVRRDF